jgi:hypothetical protein
VCWRGIFRYLAIWSKTDSEIKDIARKCKLEWTTHSSGCYKASSKFSLQSVRKFARIGKIDIVGMLDVDIKASRMVCSVVAGSFLSTYFSRQISVDLCREHVLFHWRFYHGARTMVKSRYHSKRVLIRTGMVLPT